MTSSPKKIIRGAEVEGVLFCTPTGADKEDPAAKVEKENLKALEEFWHKKGLEEGRELGFQEGTAEGEREGHRKGLQEGEQKGYAEGKEQGREEGLQEGEEKVRAELTDAISHAEAAAEEVKRYQESLYDDAKAEMVTFSLAVCEQVLRTHLNDTEQFKQVIERVIQQAQPVIKECPVELVFAHEHLKKLQEAGLDEGLKAQVGDGATVIRFTAEEGVRPGDCRLETSLGLVNFDIKRILGDLEKKVLEVRPDDLPAEAPAAALPSKAEEDAAEAVKDAAQQPTVQAGAGPGEDADEPSTTPTDS